ncbi:hypothetical protein BH20ACI4_BH20ACI4_27230 [soil metagenome]
MKSLVVLILGFIFIVSCQPISSKTEQNAEKRVIENSTEDNSVSEFSSIRKIDFQNFTFPWTKTFGGKEKSFILKNGIAEFADGRKLSLKSLSYIDIAEDYDEQALVNVKIDDGNATYEMLYIFAIENEKPKLLESFEFGKENNYFGTAFDAHGELVIETYIQTNDDAECCPSIIEISYYKWQKDKFVLQGEPQKVPNGYVERAKKKNEKN